MNKNTNKCKEDICNAYCMGETYSRYPLPKTKELLRM